VSEIFLVDFKNDNLTFNKLNALSIDIVKFCLKNNIGVFFNLNRPVDFIKLAHIKNYFLLSDNFVYDYADDLLSGTEDCLKVAFAHELELNKNLKFNISDINIGKTHRDKKFREEFYNKYNWITGLLDILFRHDCKKIDIYIDDIHCFDESDEYHVITTNEKNILKDMCDDIIENEAEWSYHFLPETKYEIIESEKHTIDDK